MNRIMNFARRVVIGAAVAITMDFAAANALAQTGYELSDFNVDTALDAMSGGGFSIETVALGESEFVASGGEFSLEAKAEPVVPILTLPAADLPELLITRNGDLVSLWWDGSGEEYLLESSSTLGENSNWQPIAPSPSGSPHTVAPQRMAQFFRLRRR